MSRRVPAAPKTVQKQTKVSIAIEKSGKQIKKYASHYRNSTKCCQERKKEENEQQTEIVSFRQLFDKLFKVAQNQRGCLF